jgi:iron(III) transport system ATP-binding protein
MNAPRPTALTVEGLRFAYDGRRVIDDVCLSLARGEIACLLGPSGCGKTTLLRLIAGLETAPQGRIEGGGRVLAENGAALPPESRGVGYVFQDYALFPHLSVAANIEFGLTHLPPASRAATVQRLLETMQLSAYANAYPHQLSGGQQQRVALARALARAPTVVLMDEPFSGMDPSLRAAIREDLLTLLRAAEATVLLVTHDAEEALWMADRLFLMKDGRIVQGGTPQDLYFHPQSLWAARFIGEGNVLTGRATGGRVHTRLGDIAADGLPDGSPAQVFVRPEAIDMGAPGAGLPDAMVRDVRLFGANCAVELALDDDGSGPETILFARVPSYAAPEPGDRVGIRLRAGLAFAFPPGEDA